MGISSMQARHANDIAGLLWIFKFGLLRTAELGRLVRPQDTHNRTHTDRQAANWVERNLVLKRKLPEGAGSVYVLSAAGVRFLNENGIAASTGKDLGDGSGADWLPPHSWKHDLIAAGVLSHLSAMGFSVVPEPEVRRNNPALKGLKIPDGLATRQGVTSWVEIERSAKKWRNQETLAAALIDVASGQHCAVSGLRPTQTIVAFRVDAMDERGYALDLRGRLTRAVQRKASSDVPVTWCECGMQGHGVAALRMSKDIIKTDEVGKILTRLTERKWQCDDGLLRNQYGKFQCVVWDNGTESVTEPPGWHYMLEDEAGNYLTHAESADDEQSAKRGCANLIAEKNAAASSK